MSYKVLLRHDILIKTLLSSLLGLEFTALQRTSALNYLATNPL